MRRRPVTRLALAALLSVAGCGHGPYGSDRPVRWDLSRAHTMREVRWPRPELEDCDVHPIGPVLIDFGRGDRVRFAPDVVAHALLHREGTRVDEIQLNSRSMTADGAYRLALDLAAQVHARREPLDVWYRRFRNADPDDAESTFTEHRGDRLGGRTGPMATVKLLPPGTGERPWIAAVELAWLTPLPRRGRAADPGR